MQCQGCGKEKPDEEVVDLEDLQYGERCLDCAHDHIFGELGQMLDHIEVYAEKAGAERKEIVVQGIVQLLPGVVPFLNIDDEEIQEAFEKLYGQDAWAGLTDDQRNQVIGVCRKDVEDSEFVHEAIGDSLRLSVTAIAETKLVPLPQ